MTLETDGEDMPGIWFTREDKIRIAQALVELGVKRLGVRGGHGKGFEPTQEEIDDYVALSRAGTGADLVAFCGLYKDDIDRAIKYDSSGVVLQGPCSDVRLKLRGITHEQVVCDVIEWIDYAKDQGLCVAYMPTDTPRATSPFLRRLLKTVTRKAEFDSVVVSDSVGCTGPFGVFHIVDEIRKTIRAPIELHCHNDFGMATANAFAGIAAGASVVHTTINGMGERAGLVALEEITMALKVFRGIDTGLKYDKLCEISKLVGELSNYPPRRNKPVVGDLAMADEIEAGVASLLNTKKEDFEIGNLPYPPEYVGNEFKVTMGPKTGAYGIRYVLKEKDISYPESEIQQLAVEVRSLAKKLKRPLTDQEFEDLLKPIATRG
jgi:isopropylmalate/homocitrate/citramalate synthase